jgi:hypothetical protein
MSKVLSIIEAVFGAVQGFAKANPALAAGAVSLLVTLLASLGLHVSTAELTMIVSAVTVFLSGLVHVSTRPRSLGEHEKP